MAPYADIIGTTTTVLVHWNAYPNADTYVVSLIPAANYGNSTVSAPSTSATLTDIPGGTITVIMVCAYQQTNSLGCATTDPNAPLTFPPSPPGQVASASYQELLGSAWPWKTLPIAGASGLAFSWTLPTQTHGAPVTGYLVTTSGDCAIAPPYPALTILNVAASTSSIDIELSVPPASSGGVVFCQMTVAAVNEAGVGTGWTETYQNVPAP
jgi:hypothetical protein